MRKLIFSILFVLVFISLVFASTLPDDLINYHPLDESAGTNIPNIHNPSLNGTLINTEDADWVVGKINNAISLDGFNEYGNLSYIPSSTGSWNVWVKNQEPSWSTSHGILTSNRDGENNGDIRVGIKNSSWHLFVSGETPTSFNNYSSTPIPNDGNYYMITVTWGASGIKLYVNSVLEATLTAVIGSPGTHTLLGAIQLGQQPFQAIFDEVGYWDAVLDQSQITELYNGGSGLSYEDLSISQVAITLDYPENNTFISDVGATFNASYSMVNFNLTNATYYVWLENGTIHNQTTVEVTGNTTNSTSLFIDDFTLGTYLWNVQVCGTNVTGTSCSFNENNYTLNVGASVDGEEYNTTTLETSLEGFSVNISLLSGTILYDANLIYNGIPYEGTITDLGGDQYYLNASIYVPSVSVDTNFTFYWSFSYDSGGSIIQNISSHQQRVYNLNAINITSSSCSAGFFEAMNFTFDKEKNFTSLSPDVQYNFRYGVGNLSAVQTYGSFTNISNFRICINQSISSYQIGYGEIDYEETGYSPRRFYFFEGQNLSNSTTVEHTLYSLINADATSFIFEAKDKYQNPYDGKYLSLLRWYPELNQYKIVEMARTDDEGKTVMKVQTEDVDYRVGLYHVNGTLIKLANSVRMACLVDPCTYTLSVTEADFAYFDLFNIESSLTYDEINGRFVYIWNDPSQNTVSMGLLVYKDAGYQQVLICNNTGVGFTGVLTCSTTGYTGSFYAKVYRTASPPVLVATLIHDLRTAISSNFGLFASALMALLAGFIGVFSPVGAIIFLLIGLIPAFVLGSITMAIFMGIVALGGIIIHFLRQT